MIAVPNNFLTWLLVVQIVLFIIQVTTGFIYAKSQKHIIFEYLSFACFGAVITIAVIILFISLVFN